MQTLFSQHWHHLPLDEVATLMESDGERGLDMIEVSRRQAHFGLNGSLMIYSVAGTEKWLRRRADSEGYR